jgi:hypothetical protein
MSVATKTLGGEQARELLGLCRTGRLYDLEKWIASGNSLQLPPSKNRSKTLLELVVEIGFHSLVELIAKQDQDQPPKNAALRLAVVNRRIDLVQLLFAHGAEISAVPLVDVLVSWDPKIIRFFVENGADLITGSPFAEAFGARVRTAIRPFLECQERYPHLSAQLQEQADRALRYFCREGDLKWTSLLLWAGASARTLGPAFNVYYTNDPECYTSGVQEACYSGKLEILKKLKPQANTDDLSELLRCAAMFAYKDVVEYLLEVGAKPNDKANGGSTALDSCLSHLNFRSHATFNFRHERSKYEVHNELECIRMLVEHGAIWKPNDKYQTTSIRRALLECEPKVTTEVVRLLSQSDPSAREKLQELVWTPRMRQHLEPQDRQLSRFGIHVTVAKPKQPPEPSAQDRRRYDREKLYEQVWSTPVHILAKEYGLSDRGLAKVCSRLRIPVPGRGYWAKRAAGKPVLKRSPLPALNGTRDR